MEKINIICVDDQREVLNTLTQNLVPFESLLIIEECESADEALEIIDEIDAEGNYVAVIISDHVMPGKNGVEFLTEVKEDGRFNETKKILLTGLATHKDTINAINQAGIDKYLEKPWDGDELIHNVKKLLTKYLIEKGISYEKYMDLLDQETLYDALKMKT